MRINKLLNYVSKNSGFTYIEVIISVMLIAIIFVPIMDSLYYTLTGLIDSQELKHASDMAVSEINKYRGRASYDFNYENLAIDTNIVSSSFIDTLTVDVVRLDADGNKTSDTICRFIYFYKQ